MSSPVTGSGTTQTVDFAPQNDALSEAGPTQATSKKTEAHQASGQSTVEAYQGPHEVPQQVADDGSSKTVADLAAQVQREGAERQQARAAVKDALEEPLMQLGQQVRDPITNTGVHFKFAEQHAFLKAIQQPEVRAAASKLSRDDVDAMMMARVMKAWPNQSPEKAEQIKDYLMKQMGADLRDSAAFEMQKVAVKTFEGTAATFEATAKNPDQVRALAQKLQGESGKALRQGIGLEDGKAATPENVSAALLDRAQLLKQEARTMEGRGTNTLFRELARHDVREAFLEQAKIRPGSFAAEQLEAVNARGESEEQTIRYAKTASAIGVAAATGGLALGGGFVFSTSLAMSAPEMLVAVKEVDGAKAGESAGTMAAGAGEAAKNKAIRTAAVGVASATVGAAISGGTHHAVEGFSKKMADVVAEQVTLASAHVVTHGVVDVGAETLGEKLLGEHPQNTKATGKNALQRASQ